ncbi:magnesium transporter [Haloimpatiens lingqiaonensis]|uniref:magnesium transporter n=1 Tax=Haloimpatiens lingqiaonensis TaxID=1380675 RepID=UPI001FA966DA|nr:magnesium transporter [Haloimpatiens lingqiaonensis]
MSREDEKEREQILAKEKRMKELDRKVNEKVMQEETQNALHENMKSKLENMPRYTYRVTKIFSKKEDLQGAIDDFNNNGIYNLNSKQLTDNYVEEVWGTCILLKREINTTLKFGLCGAILGAIIGLFQGNSVIPMPILNPVSAGGTVVSTILLSAIFFIIVSMSTAIIMLFKPIYEVSKGYYMLTIYADREDKKTIDSIIGKYITFEI